MSAQLNSKPDKSSSTWADPATAPIPTRHGCDLAESRRVARGIVRWMPRELRKEPTPAQWESLGRGLLRGDEPVDRLLDWMTSVGMKTTRPMFETALERGIDAVHDAPQPLRAFFEQIDHRPDWVDEKQLEAGARVCGMLGLDGMRGLLITGLLAGYQMSAVNRTLLITGALEKGAARRVAETTKWWMDVTTVGNMQRFNPGFKNTIRVRLIHGLVRRHVAALPDWDAAYLGLPVNQTDMQATYLGFSAVFLIARHLVGIPLSDDDREAVMQLWRYIAWVNGVAEDMLHAPSSDGLRAADSAAQLLYHNLLSQAMADDDSQRLGRSLADEPLHRSYPVFRTLRRHVAKSLHLSMARAAMDNASLRSLGLPVWRLPWYPLIAIPRNQLIHRAWRLLPGGREHLYRRGRAEQLAILPVLFGDTAPAIKDVAAPQPQGAHG